MEAITALALIWTWHFFWMLLLTYAISKAAFRYAGWPFCSPDSCRLTGNCRWRVLTWPVSGRWILAGLFLMITLMVGDVARVAWQIAIDPRPVEIGWWNVVIRASPIFLEPWTFWRQWKRGLTNDYEKSHLDRLRRRRSSRRIVQKGGSSSHSDRS